MSTSLNNNPIQDLKILIVDDDQWVSSGLSAMLQSIGFNVLACACCGSEAIDMTCRLHPDVVLMDIKMEDMDGIEASVSILELHPVPIIIVSACSDPDMIEKADQAGVAGYLVKPFMIKEIVPSITLALCRFRQLQSLKNEVGNLKESIRSRKLIEKAKGLLMERENITECQAYSRIQHMSRNRNIAMAKLAEALIIADELKPGKQLRPADH